MGLDSTIVHILSQLTYWVPQLLVSLIGMILAIVFWRRYPRPCLLTLLASSILLLSSLAQAFLQAYVLQAGSSRGWSGSQMSWAIGILAFTGSLIRAGALGLLLAAVFVGRKAPPQVEPARTLGVWDDTSTLTSPATEGPRDQGIKTRPG